MLTVLPSLSVFTLKSAGFNFAEIRRLPCPDGCVHEVIRCRFLEVTRAVMHGVVPAWASLRRRISVVGSFKGMSGILS